MGGPGSGKRVASAVEKGLKLPRKRPDTFEALADVAWSLTRAQVEGRLTARDSQAVRGFLRVLLGALQGKLTRASRDDDTLRSLEEKFRELELQGMRQEVADRQHQYDASEPAVSTTVPFGDACADPNCQAEHWGEDFYGAPKGDRRHVRLERKRT